MTFGYTGLARWQNFNTQKWLLKALHDSAPPDYSMGGILKRLKINATNTFQNHAALKSADKCFKRLSVMFSGYVNIDGGPPRQGCAILSNYLNLENNSSFAEASEEFSLYHTSAKKGVEWPTLVQRVGNWRAMSTEHIIVLRELISQKKPAEAIIGKAIKLIREMADNPKSQGTIGKQLTSIAVPYDPTLGVESNYHSDYTKPEGKIPSEKIGGKRYVKLSHVKKTIKKTLKDPEAKYRHAKDRDALNRINIYESRKKKRAPSRPRRTGYAEPRIRL